MTTLSSMEKVQHLRLRYWMVGVALGAVAGGSALIVGVVGHQSRPQAEVGEGRRVLLVVEIFDHIARHLGEPGLRVAVVDFDDARGLREGQGLEHERIHRREDGGVGANAEREREQGDRRESGRAPETPRYLFLAGREREGLAILERIAARTVETLETAVGEALQSFTPQECMNYFASSGYDAA